MVIRSAPNTSVELSYVRALVHAGDLLRQQYGKGFFLGPFQTSNFSCAESNANEKNLLFSLICIRFGTCKVRRLKRALFKSKTAFLFIASRYFYRNRKRKLLDVAIAPPHMLTFVRGTRHRFSLVFAWISYDDTTEGRDFSAMFTFSGFEKLLIMIMIRCQPPFNQLEN